jgi:alpha-glucosidase
MVGSAVRAALAPWADGVKVRGHTPLVTPWRTIQIADVSFLTEKAAT